jgi:hypothetical protein
MFTFVLSTALTSDAVAPLAINAMAGTPDRRKFREIWVWC